MFQLTSEAALLRNIKFFTDSNYFRIFKKFLSIPFAESFRFFFGLLNMKTLRKL